MRIGFEAKRLFLNDRGLGNYARNILYGLVKFYPESHYHLYTPKASKQYVNSDFISQETIHVHEPSGWLNSLSKSAWRSLNLGKIAAKDDLNVFHGLSQELPRDIKKLKAKSIVTIHDMIFLKHPEFYKPIDRRIYYSKVKFAVTNADHIVAISEQTKNDLLEEFRIAEEQISVIYQSCNEVFYSKRTPEEKEAVKQKWGLPENFLLYVGALNENKNILVILKAMNYLKGKMDLPLVIVGNGEAYKARLKDYAIKNDLSDKIIFASEASNPTPFELSSFYQLASVFIFPSFYEGFGIPILESRFSGTPVIASNSTCLEEVGGANSLFFDPSNYEQLASKIEQQLYKPVFTNPPTDFMSQSISKKFMDLYTRIYGI
ncbi:MAG: glycosyltransferase family 4 protein [Cyclobacteriaceae bacterium]|nr:glycosyltransferase family 4 protein [Cyclobacteriaceae bacterium]